MKLFLLVVFTRLIGLAPVRLLEWLSRPLGALTWAASRTKRRTTLKNLASCYPELSADERERLGRESMRHYVMTALETGMCWHWPQARILRHFDEPVGFDLVEAARSADRGVLILLPHFGNWELLNHWLQPRHDIIALYKPGRFAEVDEKLQANRIRFGAEMAPISRSGMKRFYQALKSEKLALMLPDQDPSEGQGRFAPFFGIPALTGVLASRLARQTGCTALYAVCERRGKGRYRVHFLPVDDAFHAADIDRSLAAMNQGIERCIEVNRPQYLWAYKRFKSRPEGEPRFY